SLAAVVPDLPLLRWHSRVPLLPYRRPNPFQLSWFLLLSRLAVQPLVHLVRLLLRQLCHAWDSEHLEMAKHRRPDGKQIRELPRLSRPRRPRVHGVPPGAPPTLPGGPKASSAAGKAPIPGLRFLGHKNLLDFPLV